MWQILKMLSFAAAKRLHLTAGTTARVAARTASKGASHALLLGAKGVERVGEKSIQVISHPKVFNILAGHLTPEALAVKNAPMSLGSRIWSHFYTLGKVFFTMPKPGLNFSNWF